MAVAFSSRRQDDLDGVRKTPLPGLWDAHTARPLGKPMKHQDTVSAVALSPDGKTALTGSYDKTARLWSIPSPVDGDVDRIRLRIQGLTGLELDPQGDFHVLNTETWHERRDRLERLGGPPGSAILLDLTVLAP